MASSGVFTNYNSSLGLQMWNQTQAKPLDQGETSTKLSFLKSHERLGQISIDNFVEKFSHHVSLCPSVSRRIILITMSKADEAENDVTRLIELFKFPNARFPHRFCLNGIGILDSHERITEFVRVPANSTRLDRIKFSPLYNTSQIGKLVVDADNQSNGAFRKAVRLLSYWNYKISESNKTQEKLFKSIDLLVLSLNYFYSVDAPPSQLYEFVSEIYNYSLKQIDEPIELVYQGKTIKKNRALKNPLGAKLALKSAVHSITNDNWNAIIPGVDHRSQLDQFSDDIKASIDHEKIDRIAQWVTQKLFPIMKKFDVSGSTATGTAIKGYSDIDFLFTLHDSIKWRFSDEIEMTLKTIFGLLSADAKICLQGHSLSVQKEEDSFDLVIGQENNDEITPGVNIFEVSYE